jgi:serine/threonine-protein kinase
MVLADRYRVIGLIGRGGMGEVYRADDLKLGQPVALKFLPKALADDPVRRERLFAEVRIARQVSHPNICRVYDIGELEGRHFLTMEYIDGEDLVSLLKRIGSLHGTKALDVARQLCAGLAAAHDKGVLHRDLKHVEKTDQSPNPFKKMPALAIQFWYRQSPLSLYRRPSSWGPNISNFGVTLYD